MGNREYFDHVAREWDGMRRGFFSERVREAAFAAAGLRPGGLAADVGAGTGFITEGLLQKGLRVIAVDLSEAMLAVLKEKFGAAKVDCRVGDAENLPMAGGEADYVFANMCLHHVESPPVAIKEMAWVLAPGGTLVITDLDEHGYEFLRTEQHDRWPGFKREDIRRWFTEAGLKEVKVDCVGEDCCAESDCGCDKAAISIFVASGVK